MGHRQTQHMGRSEGDDRDLAGRDAEGLEDAALDAAAPAVDEARHIQDLVDGARHEWTGNDGQRQHGGKGGAPAKGYGRGNRRPGDSGR